jgi:chromosome segregation ATPase
MMIGLGLIGLLTGSAVKADEATETKLRETLRNTMLQLRTAQNDRAALQASQAENDAKLKKLTSQVENLTKRATEAEKASAEQQAQLAKFKEAVQQWEGAYKQAVDLANTKETALAKLAGEVSDLQHRVADQQTRNAALFRTANEILTRYERFGLGEALAAKEPFVGVTRVKLENLVQDYEDKLADEKIKDSGRNKSTVDTASHQVTKASEQNSRPKNQP